MPRSVSRLREVKLSASNPSGLEVKAFENMLKQDLEKLEQVKRVYRTHRGLEIEILLKKNPS